MSEHVEGHEPDDIDAMTARLEELLEQRRRRLRREELLEQLRGDDVE